MAMTADYTFEVHGWVFDRYGVGPGLGSNEALFSWIYRESGYANSLCAYAVDDANGRIYEGGRWLDPNNPIERDAQGNILRDDRSAYRAAAVARMIGAPIFSPGERRNDSPLAPLPPPIRHGVNLSGQQANTRYYSFFVGQNGAPGANQFFPFDQVNSDSYMHFEGVPDTDSSGSEYFTVEDMAVGEAAVNPYGWKTHVDFDDLHFYVDTLSANVAVNVANEDQEPGMLVSCESGAARQPINLAADCTRDMGASNPYLLNSQVRLTCPNNGAGLVLYDAPTGGNVVPWGKSWTIQQYVEGQASSAYWVQATQPGVSMLQLEVEAPGGQLRDKDTAFVTGTLGAELTAYRPQHGCGTYAPFQKTAVKDADEESETLGPGIRINGDDDDHDGGLPPNYTPDYQDELNYCEDDLIEVLVTRESASDAFRLQGEGLGTSLRMWELRNKAHEIPYDQDLPFLAGASSLTIWAEWAAPMNGLATLEVRRTGLGQLCDKLVFHTFFTIAVVLGGETQSPDPAEAPFVIGDVLYKTGYDAYIYNEADVSPNGAGQVYDDIVQAVQFRGVGSVVAVGYSHGRGAVYNLCNRLDSMKKTIGDFEILYTGYIDAIRADWDAQNAPERRRPPGSWYHATFYQHGSVLDLYLDGAPTNFPPGADEEVDVEDHPWGVNATHFTIVELPQVQSAVISGINAHIMR